MERDDVPIDSNQPATPTASQGGIASLFSMVSGGQQTNNTVPTATVQAAQSEQLRGTMTSTHPKEPKYCNVPVPKMGGVFQPDPPAGDWLAWTGGKPKNDWSGLDSTSPTKPTPNQLRALGTHDTKPYIHRSKGLDIKFSKGGDLPAFQRKVLSHLKDCGMDTVTYFPDPTLSTRMTSVVEFPNRFTKEYVIDHYQALTILYDDYDTLNSKTAKEFLLNSLSPEMEKKVIESLLSHDDPPFVIVWMTLVEKIRIISVARFDILEKKVRNRKPTDYAGQDLDTMAEDNIRDLRELEQGCWFSASTGIDMVEAFASANKESSEFQFFANKTLTEYREAVLACRHMDRGDATAHMRGLDLDYESVCNKFGNYYRQAFQDRKWLPATNMVDPRTVPKNYSSNMAVDCNAPLSKAQIMNLIQTAVGSKNGSTPMKNKSATSSTCHNCGKPGHWARDCRAPRHNKSGNGNSHEQRDRGSDRNGAPHQKRSGGKRNTIRTSWTRIPPDPGTSNVRVENSKTFYWCDKCSRWTTSHDTAQHRSTKEQANLTMIQDFAAWHLPVATVPLEVTSGENDWLMTSLAVALALQLAITVTVISTIYNFQPLFAAMYGFVPVMLAPLSWITSLCGFLLYQPIFSQPTPDPAPPRLTRAQKRRYAKLVNRWQRRYTKLIAATYREGDHTLITKRQAAAIRQINNLYSEIPYFCVHTVTNSTKSQENKASRNKQMTTNSIIWDSGASISISPDPNDFVGVITKPDFNSKLKGIAKGVKITGQGYVVWPMQDIHGQLRAIKVPALLVPSVKQRLLSTSSLLQTYNDETIALSEDKATLSGTSADNKRNPIEAWIDPTNNLPTSWVYNYDTTRPPSKVMMSKMTTTVQESNYNLTEPEKELLRWHYRLAHISFKRVQLLFRSGVLARGDSNRHLHTAASKIKYSPKCAACLFGKQCRRSTPTTSQAKVSDSVGALSVGNILPGQKISVDHFVCTVKGRLFTSRGKSDPADMYSGGCVFVDHSSGLIHAELQKNLNTHETLMAKQNFELMARDQGVIPQAYLSDNGPAFTSHEFSKKLQQFEQVIRFAGAGAHHQNGIAERSIRTVISIARTMMIHSAVHWPDMSDPCLWPMAVKHAAYVFNRMPSLESGLCPIDLFSRQRWKQTQLHDLHVFGCPVYVLDKNISDGKKISKWAPRSHRFVYVGLSPKHASTVPLLLNPESGVISPHFHVVFDDWFATISTDGNGMPDFNSDQWMKLFGDSVYQYVFDEHDDMEEGDLRTTSDVLDRRARVEKEMDFIHPIQPLQITAPLVREEIKPMVDDNAASIQEFNQQAQYDPPVQREPSPQHKAPVMPTESVPAIQYDPPVQREPSPQHKAPVMPTESVPAIQEESPRRQREDEVNAPISPPVKSTSLPVALRRSERNRRPNPKYLHQAVYQATPVFMALHNASLSYLQNALCTTTPPPCAASTLISTDAFKASVGDPDTLSYDQAMADKDHVDEWRVAMKKEIEMLEKLGTWTIDNSANATSKILPGTWVFKVKRSPDGEILKHKARYCVRGDLQEGTRETFAPVVNWSTIRLFLIMSSLLDWETRTIDFSCAFVQAALDEPTWIHLPRGFHNGPHQHSCLRLKKSLYGLSAAPRLWYLHLFDAFTNKLGFVQSTHDPCLLLKEQMMIVTFVDDCGIAYKLTKDFEKLIKDLRNLGFELTEEGSFSSFLGIKFNKDEKRGTITMTQTALIQRIINATGLQNCNPNWTPTSQTALGTDKDGPTMTDTWSYRSIIGMMLYLATNTRPDIAFAVSQAARFSNNPKKSHATAVKTIVRYLSRTSDKGTIVTPTGKLNFELYVDADFAGLYKCEADDDSNSARSRTGYVLLLGGFPLIWKSHLQTEISLSTLEAEYSALSSALRAFIPIRELLFEISEIVSLPSELTTTIHSEVFEDNQGAFLLANNQRITSRTKYFLVKWHHFWWYITLNDGDLRKIFVKKIGTDLQAADFLTKAVPRVIFENNRFTIIGW